MQIERMQRALDRTPSVARRIFTDEERIACERTPWPAEHYAARYAARQAVLKALGLQLGRGVGCQDVWIQLDDQGRPHVALAGEPEQAAQRRGVREVAISLSFTHEVATAIALLITDDVRPQPKEERRDPQREFLASFREARSLLDELDERLPGS
jgi:holo-[acyl-carrier protein] synthase